MSAGAAMPPVKPGDNNTPSAAPAAPAAVEFHYTQTDSFVALLRELGASLLVSTYQANKLLAVRADGAGLSTLVRTFDRPMGIAVGRPPAGAGHAATRCGSSATPRTSPRGSSRPAGTTPATCRGRATSPATSASTSWPGPATSCGWSTPGSRACAPSTRTTASSRGGGRRSSPPWRPRTAAT